MAFMKQKSISFLSVEIRDEIFSFCSYKELQNIAGTCRGLRKEINDHARRRSKKVIYRNYLTRDSAANGGHQHSISETTDNKNIISLLLSCATLHFFLLQFPSMYLAS